jgi:adenine C2-methylase RlmN of 23S rRNA A2503 and tRNA A37
MQKLIKDFKEVEILLENFTNTPEQNFTDSTLTIVHKQNNKILSIKFEVFFNGDSNFVSALYINKEA